MLLICRSGTEYGVRDLWCYCLFGIFRLFLVAYVAEQLVTALAVSSEGTPSFATVATAYDAHLSMGSPPEGVGSVSISPKGLAFTATQGEVCHVAVFHYGKCLILAFRAPSSRWRDYHLWEVTSQTKLSFLSSPMTPLLEERAIFSNGTRQFVDELKCCSISHHNCTIVGPNHVDDTKGFCGLQRAIGSAKCRTCCQFEIAAVILIARSCFPV